MWLRALRSSVVNNNKARLRGNHPAKQIPWELGRWKFDPTWTMKEEP